jgi:cellobiose-specific phosphotransferase system component IIA
MNNTQLYLSIGLPLFTLLLVFIANNRAIDALRSEMKTSTDALRTEIKMSTDALRINHDSRLAVLEARILERAS